MVASVLQSVAVGWAVGNAAGTLLARRAAQRGWEIDATDVRERCALAGAGAGLVLSIMGKLV